MQMSQSVSPYRRRGRRENLILIDVLRSVSAIFAAPGELGVCGLTALVDPTRLSEDFSEPRIPQVIRPAKTWLLVVGLLHCARRSVSRPHRDLPITLKYEPVSGWRAGMTGCW